MDADKLGWASTWTAAMLTDKSTSCGTAILWRKGLPIWAPATIQNGLVRAPGRSTAATLQWPKCKPIELASLYLEVGGKLSTGNLQILADVSLYLKEKGNPFWLAGDWQVDSVWLQEVGWLKNLNAHVRAGNPAVGSCTAMDPASNIDYHVIHKSLQHFVAAAEIDLGCDLSPHRPVWGMAAA